MKTKTLYLIRHAKAEEYAFGKRDYDRNLTEKGKERAVQIASTLAQQLHPTPSTQILSSSANRAIQTAYLFSEIIGYPMDQILQDKSIYEAYHLDILHAINKTSMDVDTLLVFGHNPGISELTTYLTNVYVDLKTSHVAILELEEGLDFKDLSGGTATLKTVITE